MSDDARDLEEETELKLLEREAMLSVVGCGNKLRIDADASSNVRKCDGLIYA